MLCRDDQRKAITWAWLTAKKLGWVVTRSDGMIWVNNGKNDIGCDDDMDFVGFMSEEIKTLRK